MQTRRSYLILGAAIVAEAIFNGSALALDVNKKSHKDRVFKIVAQKFSYSPNEIILKKGETAVLEFTALDFTHGFKIPDLNIRADLPPGKITTIRVTPQNIGVYDFLCDNFCGAGHEEMNGRIIVR